MNRNRFAPPQPYSNELSLNSMGYGASIPRFNVWQSSLTPVQNAQQSYNAPQAKKNYCSTCDMWTSEAYNNHQISPAHLAKKVVQRGNQNYQTSYSNTNSSSSITSISSLCNNTNNANSNKRKFKRTNKRVSCLKFNSFQRTDNQNRRQSATKSISEGSGNHEEQKIEANNLPEEKKDDKPQLKEVPKMVIVNKNRGQEMLIPVNGVFCALCEIFFANKDVAENDHCSTQAHCEAYEKLLKRVQESKSERRSNEKSPDDDDNYNANVDADGDNDNCKRLKLTQSENQDKDFRILSSIHAIEKEGKNSDPINDSQSSVKDGEEIDRNSTNDFNAPDFSLDFPDDMEDYVDDIDMQQQSNSKTSAEKSKSTVVASNSNKKSKNQ